MGPSGRLGSYCGRSVIVGSQRRVQVWCTSFMTLRSMKMTVTTAAEVVGEYTRAIGAGDMPTARSLMADDMHCTGPIDTFQNRDDFLASLGKLAQIVTGMDVHRVVADGDDVVTIYDLKTTVAGLSPVAEWATVKDGKIVEIRVFFDARPFAALFEQHRG